MNSRNVRDSRLKYRFVLGGALMAAAALAHAQYVWVDDKKVKHYSDRPPAASVPIQRILKAPGPPQRQNSATETPAADGNAGAAPGKAKAPPTLAERNADFRKRKTDVADKEGKAEEQARREADMASNCNDLRKNRQMLESGTRVGTVDKNGERAFMSDDERAQQVKKVQRLLANCK